jgi:hypothetical protein
MPIGRKPTALPLHQADRCSVYIPSENDIHLIEQVLIVAIFLSDQYNLLWMLWEL